MRQSIRGYADAVIDQVPQDQIAGLAADLAGVRDVIAGSDDLIGVLSDGGVPLPSRRAILDDLFGSRIAAPASRLLSFVLEADRASGTVEDIAWVAERFDAASKGLEPTGAAVLGHTAAEERVSGYATAVLETADRRELGEIEDELFRFQQTVAGSEQLSDALVSRDLPVAAREGIVTDLLGSKATPASTALACYATRVGRPRDYEELLGALVDRVAAETNRRIADVHSAVDLDEGQRQKLAGALARSLGHDVEVRVTVDPSVVAGFVAVVGDTVVDGSARRQLELLRERLVSPEATSITTGERH